MKYIKLIALNIGDFYSTIHFEKNYSATETDVAKRDMRILEYDGYKCLLFEMVNDIIV